MKSFNFALVTLTICPLIILSSSEPEKSLSYKSSCVQDEECDTRKFLECNKLSYVCDCPRNTIWNSNHQLCMTMESRPCHHYHKRNSQYTNLNPHYLPLEPECTSNSSCIANKCECDDGFLKNGFGSCDLSYNMPCSNNPEDGKTCAWRYLLECPNKNPTIDVVDTLDTTTTDQRQGALCKCKGEWVDFIWDENRRKCVSLVGTACDMDGKGGDDKLECVENAECINGSCQCSLGHSETPQRTCLLKYGEKCDNSAGEFCNKYNFLNCQDGKCGCEFYGQMEYDEEIQECRMFAGEFCDLPLYNGEGGDGGNNVNSINANLPANYAKTGDGRMHRCIRDAECVAGTHHRSGKGKCECKAGKFRASDGTCTSAKGHGLPCSFPGDCNKGHFLTCVITEEQGGLCECNPTEMVYDGTSCIVLPGRSCLENRKCARNSNCENGEYCLCNEGYVLDPINLNCHLPEVVGVLPKEGNLDRRSKSIEEVVGNGLDLGDEVFGQKGGDWVSWNDCSGMPQDTPMFEKCECSLQTDTRLWSEGKQKCLGLVGSYCQFNESCVDHAYCDVPDMICQCDSTVAKTTLDNVCILRRSNIGHQPYQGHPDGNYIHDGNEKSRVNRRIMASSTGGRSTSFFFDLMTLTFCWFLAYFGYGGFVCVLG